MRIRSALAAGLLLLLLSGCWSHRELTELGFAGTLGLDWEDGQYRVTVTILMAAQPNTMSEQSAGRAGAVWVVSERAGSLDGALSRIDQVLARSLTMDHVRSVIVGQELARRGIGPAIDFLLRSVEIRPAVWVGISPERAVDLMKATPRQEIYMSNGPLGHHDTAARRLSLSPARRLAEVAYLLQEEGISLTLPMFRTGDKPAPADGGAISPQPDNAGEVVIGGSGVFRGDKLVGWLGTEESRGLLWAQGAVGRGAVEAPCDNSAGQAVFHLREGTGGLQVSIAGGKPRARIAVQVTADLNELGCSIDLPEPAYVRKLEELLARQVEREVKEAVRASREYQSDILGFGQNLYRKEPDLYDRLAKRWLEDLEHLTVTVEVTARVARLGQTNKRFRWNPAE